MLRILEATVVSLTNQLNDRLSESASEASPVKIRVVLGAIELPVVVGVCVPQAGAVFLVIVQVYEVDPVVAIKVFAPAVNAEEFIDAVVPVVVKGLPLRSKETVQVSAERPTVKLVIVPEAPDTLTVAEDGNCVVIAQSAWPEPESKKLKSEPPLPEHEIRGNKRKTIDVPFRNASKYI